jgi:hypothetical protein
MKFTVLLLMLLFISCTTPPKATVVESKEKAADEIVEGVVISKDVPKSINGFRYVKEINTYFKNTISKKVEQRIYNSIKRSKEIKDDKSRFTRQVSALSSQFKYPFWSDYFGDEAVNGSIRLNIRVGKDGLPEIIIVESGIQPDVDRIFVEHATRFPFQPAIHKKSKKPVRAWIKIQNTF